MHPPHRRGRTGGSLRVSRTQRISSGELFRTEVVCFCDIPAPLRRIHMNKYSEFGLSFPKAFLVLKGASPVFYIASTSKVKNALGNTVARASYFDESVKAYMDISKDVNQWARSSDERFRSLANNFLHVQHLLDFHVFSFMKFFDPSTDIEGGNNFYMEREWRVYGNVDFQLSDVLRITVPKTYAGRLRMDFPDLRETTLKRRFQPRA